MGNPGTHNPTLSTKAMICAHAGFHPPPRRVRINLTPTDILIIAVIGITQPDRRVKINLTPTDTATVLRYPRLW